MKALLKPVLFALAAVLLLIPVKGDAAVTPTPVFGQTPRAVMQTFVQGTDVAGTYKTIVTGGANGSKVIGIYVTTTDATATHLLTFQWSDSTTDHCATATTCGGGAVITTDLGAGFAAGMLPHDVMESWTGLPRDSDGNKFIFLKDTTDTLEMTFATALTASTKINVVVVVVDF